MQVGAWVGAPIYAYAQPVGALCALDVVPRSWTREQREQLWDLAGSVGEAVEHTEPTARERSLAHALRRGLMPKALHAPPGTEVAGAWHGAGHGLEVGGDFYDIVEGSAGWMLTIGDVSGRGADAAACGAHARWILHAAALAGTEPRTALELLDDTLRGARQLATALAAKLDLLPIGGARLELASAGQPAPYVLRAGGACERAAAGGKPLGPAPEGSIAEHDLVLAAGDTVVLFTDGLLHVLGDAGVQALMHESSRRSATLVIAAIESRLLAQGDLADDVAALALTVCA